MAERIRFDDLDGDVEEAPGLVESAALGAAQGATLNLGDEMEGAQQAGLFGLAAGGDALLSGDWERLKKTPEAVLAMYRARRDARRRDNQVAEAANPKAYAGGQAAGAIGTGLATGGIGAGLRGAMATGALEGAAGAVGASEEDLTTGDVGAYARTALEGAGGAAMGAAFGAGGHVVGQGLRWVGGKALGALRGARGEVLDEVSAARAAEDAAARKAAHDAEVKMGKKQAAGQKEDKAFMRQQAREAERAARAGRGGGARAGGPRTPTEDPDTRVLEGYGRGARKLRKDNAREVYDAREHLKRPDISPAERKELEDYIRLHGDAVDEPVRFRLRSIEENLRKRYSSEVVERLMKRFDADGNAVSRSRMQAQQPLLPDQTATQPMGYSDVAKQGRAVEVARMGGGGRSAMENYGERLGMDDAFHEAKTQAGLVRTSPEGGVQAEYMDGPMHYFEFKDPSSDEIFEVVVSESRKQPGVLYFENVYPKSMPSGLSKTPEGHAKVANSMGPRAMRQLFGQLAKAFPDASRLKAHRETGWAPGRDMDLRLPEVTRPGAPEFRPDVYSDGPDGPVFRNWPGGEATAPEAWPLGMDGDDATAALDYSDVARQGRAEDVLRMGGGGRSALSGRTRPYGEPEGLPAPEDITRPGLPPPGAPQRFSVLGAPPALREGVDLPRYGATRAQPQARVPGQHLRGVVGDGPAFTADDMVEAMGANGAPSAGRHLNGVVGSGPAFSADDMLEAMAMRRARAAQARVASGPMTPAPTRNARPRAIEPEREMEAARRVGMGPESSMRAPEDVALSPEDALTRATSVPAVRRPEPMEPTRLLPRQQTPASAERTRYGPPGLETRLGARPSVEELAEQRIANGGQDIRRAFMEGATDSGAAAFGGIGLALGGLDGGLGAVLASGGRGAARELLKNPAARARALEAFKIHRLASLRPDVFARVGVALSNAQQKSPERYAATRHALLLKDPEFRAAEAEVAREVADLDDEALAERLTAR